MYSWKHAAYGPHFTTVINIITFTGIFMHVQKVNIVIELFEIHLVSVYLGSFLLPFHAQERTVVISS